jgi:hypothetical protein
MSYYACDPANADELVPKLTQEFAAAARTTHWYALVDLAFDEGVHQWPLAVNPLHLYADGHLAQLRSVSPVLSEVPVDQPDKAAKMLRRLIRHAGGRPMLSLMGAALPIAELTQAMQHVLEVETADGQPFLLRLADTRVLPTLPLTLTTAHWAQICAPLDSWLVVDRFGALAKLPMPRQQGHGVKPASCIRLDDHELSAVLQAGEADALIQAVHESDAQCLPQRSRAALHGEVHHVCTLAQAYGIEDAPDRLALVLANRLAGGELWRDARLARWLEQGRWPAGGLSDALGEFVEGLT